MVALEKSSRPVRDKCKAETARASLFFVTFPMFHYSDHALVPIGCLGKDKFHTKSHGFKWFHMFSYGFYSQSPMVLTILWLIPSFKGGAPGRYQIFPNGMNCFVVCKISELFSMLFSNTFLQSLQKWIHFILYTVSQ